ncbi:MAG: D-aminoacyl-tRNA deacylase [Planctomycetota bacterium]|jgi:D-tyrosyl-tRNA(Tyr) deacylase|nr:D-aminoacyl-tRNA deacylase [Planctomycetota bacterium]
MKIVAQRVKEARVIVAEKQISEIHSGLLLFLGIEKGDTESNVTSGVTKVSGLRLFEDEQGKMNRSNEEMEGSFLVVSQFTLCANLSKGKRPGFDRAMKPPESERLYRLFCQHLEASTGRPVLQGQFGAHMHVELVNDGPATFLLEFPVD